MPNHNPKTEKSNKMVNQKLKSKNSFNPQPKIWFWPFFIGIFFGIGYSITKNIVISKVLTKESTQTNFKNLKKNKKNSTLQNILVKRNYKKNTIEKTNFSKTIDVRTYDNFIKSINLNYSDRQNSKELRFFENCLNFFEKETVESLMKTLINTKKTKSSKVKAD